MKAFILILIIILFSSCNKNDSNFQSKDVEDIIKSNKTIDSSLKANTDILDKILPKLQRNDSLIKVMQEDIKQLKQEKTTTQENNESKPKQNTVKTKDELRKLLTDKSLNQIIKMIGKPDDVTEYSDKSKSVVWKNIAKDPLTGKTVYMIIQFYSDDSFKEMNF